MMTIPIPRTTYRLALIVSLIAVVGCGSEHPAEPALGPQFASGGAAAPLAVTPATLTFSLPPATPASISVTVQYLTTITAVTSDASCATVSPGSVPAQKPAGSSVYLATFSVTPVGAGTCTITLTDKKGRQVTVAVTVTAAPRIVFVSDRDGNPEIYAIDADGSDLTRLTVAELIDRDPAVSPDGSRIAFISDQDGPLDPWLMNSDGSSQVRRTISHQSSTPTFSPDGSHLLFIDFAKRVNRVGRAGDHPNDPQVITDGTLPAHHAAYSPDETRIVLGALVDDPDLGDVYDVHVMDSSGANLTRLTFHAGPTPTLRPSFSRDGSRIVYASHHAAGPGIYVMNSDGTGSTIIPGTSLADGEPSFSPDGTRIVFSSTRDGQREIYIMNVDGSGVVRVTDSPADDSFPSVVP